jgi:hypothetical protein
MELLVGLHPKLPGLNPNGAVFSNFKVFLLYLFLFLFILFCNFFYDYPPIVLAEIGLRK